MSTRKQRAANRANAQKSTAPCTPESKPASRYNPLKHGIDARHQIMFDETAEDLAHLAAECHEHHSPADPGQRFLVDTLVNNEWRIRRLRRTEAELWEHATNAFLAGNIEAPASSSGDAFATASPTFERLQRVINACERNYHRALKQLQVARAHGVRSPQTAPQLASAPAAAPQPQQSKTTSANLASFRQNPKTPPANPNSNSAVPAENPVASPNSAPSPTPAGQSESSDTAKTL
jgi:hypothetical protein